MFYASIELILLFLIFFFFFFQGNMQGLGADASLKLNPSLLYIEVIKFTLCASYIIPLYRCAVFSAWIFLVLSSLCHHSLCVLPVSIHSKSHIALQYCVSSCFCKLFIQDFQSFWSLPYQNTLIEVTLCSQWEMSLLSTF